MAIKRDEVVDKMLFVIGIMLTNTSDKFARYTWSEQNRRMLRLLDLHDLARPVKQEGGEVTWTATEEFVSLAGEFTHRAQPHPAHVAYNGSYASIFERHIVRCIDAVESYFEIEYGPRPSTDTDVKEILNAVNVIDLADAHYENSLVVRLVREILAIERQRKVAAANRGDGVVLNFPTE
jgi:hypothetical protein